MSEKSSTKKVKCDLNKAEEHLAAGNQRIKAAYFDEIDVPDDFVDKGLDEPPHVRFMDRSQAV